MGRDKLEHEKDPREQWVTHFLVSTEKDTTQDIERNRVRKRHSHPEEQRRGTSQNMKRIQADVGHSLAGKHTGRDKSGHRKNLAKRGTLTSWRAQWEGQVRTWKESDQVRGTHFLKSAEARTS